MAVKFFVKTIFLLKVDHFEEFLNQCKIDRMVNDIIQAAVTRNDFKKTKKDDLQYLNKPTS